MSKYPKPGDWCTSVVDKKWRKQGIELAEFVEKNDRWPSRVAGSRNERMLGEWLSVQRRYRGARTYLGGRPYEDRAVWLDEVALGWSGERVRLIRRTFEERVNAVAAFRAENGRFPILRQQETERVDENRDAAWLYTQRAADHSAEHLTMLNAMLPGWNPNSDVTAHETWLSYAHRVQAFAGSNSRWPRKDASPRIPLADGEHTLGVWLVNQRSLMNKGHRTKGKLMGPERVNLLDGIIPGWRPDTRVSQSTWDESLTELSKYWTLNSGPPRIDSDTLAERVSARWYFRQRNAWRTGDDPNTKILPLDEDKIVALDAAVPEWNSGNERRVSEHR
jgi:hypothetical protein